MVHNVIGVIVTATSILLVCSGCEMPPIQDSEMLTIHKALDRSVSALEDDGSDLLSARHLEAILGKPEMILSMREFEALDHASADVVPYFKTLVKHMEPKHGTSQSCKLWVYSWTEPIEWRGMVYGFFVRRQIFEQRAYVYFVFGSKVVYCYAVRR